MTERVSRFNEYRGYSTPEYDGWRRFSQYVSTRDGTRLAVDYYRPTKSGELHQEPLPVVWSHTRYQRANITAGKLYTGLDYHSPLINVLQHGYVICNRRCSRGGCLVRNKIWLVSSRGSRGRVRHHGMVCGARLVQLEGWDGAALLSWDHTVLQRG